MRRASTANPAPIPAHVADQAIQWMLALQSGDADVQAHQGCAAWRTADPEHERAWQRLHAGQDLLNRLQAARGPAMAALTTLQARTRRRLLKTVVMTGVLAGAGWLGAAQRDRWQPLLAHYRTRAGERLTVRLEDGGSLLLNTATAIDVRYEKDVRRVIVLAGEVLVQTAPDSLNRPFVVQTRQGMAWALGTRYVVRRLAHATRVDVLAGRVRLQTGDGGAHGLLLAPGERGELHDDGRYDRLPGDPEVAAWKQDMLVASDMPLDQFLDELSRYTEQRIDYAPELARLTLSGSYPLKDVNRVLAALPRILPVQVTRQPARWRHDTVRVGLRQAPSHAPPQ